MKQFLPLLLLVFVYTGCRQSMPDKQLPVNAVKLDTITSTPAVEAIICRVPIEAEFPGGGVAWQKFLAQNLVYPQSAIDKEIQGTVIVKFVVEKDGSLTDVEAIKGHMELRQSAMLVIKRSPKWIPEIQNGNNVRSYKMQPIMFRLEEE